MVKISGIPGGMIPLDQPRGGAAPVSAPGQADVPATQPVSSVQAGETVSLSARAEDAAALLKGVSAADQPEADAEVQRLTQAVADGSYHPPAAKIASAMQSFERLVARKLGRD
ncbi:MAG: flagellar biosynthesis anti-sigma factor FlgM [Paracoccaceae bacterium]|nr:flagellar biosynthesis anti-sigma factor FlgM [Paracoccaceae bacterium]